MEWKLITGAVMDIKKEVGKEYIGTYVGRKDIMTKLGSQVIWSFTDEDGQPFAMYGFTNLNRVIESVAPGQTVKITYLGTKNIKTKFGMKDVHQVSVYLYEEEVGE